jgi:hypothetical protein
MEFLLLGIIVLALACREDRAMLESNPSARQDSTERWGYSR